MSFTKKSNWADTSLNSSLAAELQRMDDGIQDVADRDSIASADKVANSFTLQLNRGTVEGATKFTFDGSSEIIADLTSANMYGITDGWISNVAENKNGESRYCMIMDKECESTYFQLNQTVLLTTSTDAAFVTVTLKSTSSKIFSTYDVTYVPLTKDSFSIISNLFAGIVNVSADTNKFELWYFQDVNDPSIAITPIGRNQDNHVLDMYSIEETASGSSDPPSFDTTIALYEATQVATRFAAKRSIDGVEFDGSSDVNRLYLCDTAASVNPKEIAAPDFTVADGSTINVVFSEGNTATPTPLQLTINGITNDVNVNRVSYLFDKNRVYTFVYYAGVWHLQGNYNYVMLNGFSTTKSTGTSYMLSVSRRGTWSPAIYGLNLSSAYGGWCKIGSYVRCWFTITIPYQQASTSGGLSFSGLPYTPYPIYTIGDVSSNNFYVGSAIVTHESSLNIPVIASIQCLNSTFYLINDDSSGPWTGLYWNSIFTETSDQTVVISGSFSYMTLEE